MKKGREESTLEHFYMTPCGKYIVFTGKDGHLSLLSGITKQWVADMKMNSQVRDVAFSKENETMYSLGSNGDVYAWDYKNQKCLFRFTDQGFIGGGVIAVSPDNHYIAVGSSSGIVNLYSVEDCSKSSNPQPVKVIDNLVTGITSLVFNHDSQILAIASKFKKDAFKLFHVSSLKMFSNWPTDKTPLSYVNCVDFSPQSGYLAMGNDKGKVLLYRLNAYENY